MRRYKHSLSNYKLLTMNQGPLTPIGLIHVNPGDTIQQATSALIRTSPLLSPVMHPVHARIHHFFVPHRLIWEDFEKFITGGPDGMDASVMPTITFTSPAPTDDSLASYLGVPSDTLAATTTVNALAFRGYALIWNEFYRDQDLQTALTIDKTSGPDTTTNTTLQNVAWEKDYFTTSRPWAHKGPDITIPMGDTAFDVVKKSNASSGFWAPWGSNSNSGIGGTSPTGAGGTQQVAGANATWNPNSSLEVDIADAAGSLLQLRENFALLRYQEARARYGSRFTEYLAYLGIRASDARLQRPEYLGGGKQTIQFSEVLQTAPTTDGDDTEGVGNLKGHGIGSMRSNRYRRFFEEHGFVFSFLSVKPKTIYSANLPRHWLYATKEDFWQKELEHVGQQPVWNRELGPSLAPKDTWGWQNRYDEYRRIESTVAGEFRNTLEYWHMARNFASGAPTLNGDFVKSNPTDRIYASTTTDQLYVMANHSVQARRLITNNTSSNVF